MSAPSLLHFPSSERIVSFLDQHSLTKKEVFPFLIYRERILSAVAAVFENQHHSSKEMNEKVVSKLDELNKTYDLSRTTLNVLKRYLSTALEDCANNKNAPLEKKEEAKPRKTQREYQLERAKQERDAYIHKKTEEMLKKINSISDFKPS